MRFVGPGESLVQALGAWSGNNLRKACFHLIYTCSRALSVLLPAIAVESISSRSSGLARL